MASMGKQLHESWSSRFTFIMAAVGAAVGLGNFWRFPYETGKNGGGAFVFVYVICVLAVAIPLVVSELFIGRRAGLSAIGSTRKVALDEGKSKLWQIIGWNGMVVGLLILSFYSVIAGWVISYIPKMALGQLNNAGADGVAAAFDGLLANPGLMIITHTLFIAVTVLIVWRGLHKGIEVAVNILMPAFFALLIFMAIYACIIGDFGQAVAFLFQPDFSKITPGVIVSALGQAFFSVGVGIGIMITYGAYLGKDTNIAHSAVIIGVADTFVAIAAGLLIFPIVFGFGLEPNQGPGLLFVTLPIAFAQMPGGQIIGTLFFSLAFVAAITSSISMLEIFTSWAEEHGGLARHRGAILGGVIAWSIGLLTVFSFTSLKDFYLLGMIPKFATMHPFDLIDYISGKIVLPISGLLVALFTGWAISKKTILDELKMSDLTYQVWRILVRYVSPVAIVLILLFETGILRL